MMGLSPKAQVGVILKDRPRVLIEEWLPIQEIGIECIRERSTGQQPPDKRLHVWWARRPLAVSRAAVLASLLPSDFPKDQFMRLMGIFGDPVAGRKLVDEVIAGIRKQRVKDPYGYPRAFTYTPTEEQILEIRKSMRAFWSKDGTTVLDSFAGGGSIPLEAYRLGFDIIVSELNPVACVIEKATIEYSSRFGPDLARDIDRWGKVVAQELEKALEGCFPRRPGETDLCYIWVRTVSCPDCHLVVPLSPNWWLDNANKLGYEPFTPPNRQSNECSF